jgi:hypothetical protein
MVAMKRDINRKYPTKVEFRFESEADMREFFKRLDKLKTVHATTVHGDRPYNVPTQSLVLVEVMSAEQMKCLRDLDRRIAASRERQHQNDEKLALAFRGKREKGP